jgi:predicted permease
MPADRGSSPPRLATFLLRGRLPEELADAVAGDLEEEYRTRVAPVWGRVFADLWFWGQVARLRAGTLRRICRRLRPTRGRSHPPRLGCDKPSFWSRMPMRVDDFKYAVRRLARSPGFTSVAVLSLALGIGANTAMFSLVNAVLLRHLPLKNRERLVEVYTSTESNSYAYSVSSYPDYKDLRENNDVFSDVVGTETFIARMDLSGEPEVMFGELISWDYFRALGVPMALGRSFLPEEDATPGTHPVTILGHRTWRRRFGGDPGVLGRTVRVDGRSYTVVGVAPEAFTGSMPVMVTGLYLPLMMRDQLGQNSELVQSGAHGQTGQRGSRSMFLKARLKPGVTVEQANAALKAFSARLAERYPDSNEGRTMSALPTGDVALHPLVDGMLKPVAAVLLGVVGLVLLIACANLASFLLAKAEDRRKEVAVRLALGATRWALVRQLLVEAAVLVVVGGSAGIVLAHWTLSLLMNFRPPLPVPVSFSVPLDGTVLWFTAGVSILAGLAFGLVPALQATNPDVAPTLKNEGTGGGRPRRFSLRNGLVVVQVAFSFVLLIGAGLFVRSLQKAEQIDPGFDVGPAALVRPMPQMAGYDNPEKRRAFYQTYEERLLAHPAITAVTMADRLPLDATIQTRSYILPGVPSDARDGGHEIDNTVVSPSYFETMAVPILQGRSFRESDRGGDPVVVVSEAFRNRFYPGKDVVGLSIESQAGERLRIVGVARDTKVRTLGEPARPYVYQLEGGASFMGMEVVVKGRGTAESLLATARQVLHEVDPDMVVMEAKTMNEHLALMLFPPRMAAFLLSVFGGLALTLAAIGIYGVVSYAVSKRRREIGIRMSLGASARNVVAMAVGGGMRLVLVGGAVGVALAAAVSWVLKAYLYGIGSTDLATFVAIPLILSGVAFVAALVPARRASVVDPVRALRSE